MKKKIFICLGFTLLIVSGAIYYVFNKPHRKASGEDAAYSMKAEQLFKEYESDEGLANKKYLNKVIEVKGKITKVQNDQNSGVVLILDEKDGMLGVSCSIDEGSKEKAQSLKEGQDVILKGICMGGDAMFGVSLNKCEVK